MGTLTLANLSSKEIRIALKKHISAEELCEKYNCTDDELARRITTLFKSDKERSDIVRQLKNSPRRPVKQAAKKEDTKLDPVKSESAIRCDVLVPAIISLDKDTPSSVPTEASQSDQLSELKSREQELSGIVMQHENDHVALASEHRSHIKSMRALEGRLAELKIEMLDLGREYEDIATKSNEVVLRMNELLTKLRTELTELDGVRLRISELERIVIAVSASDIEVLSGPSDFAPDDSGAEDLARELFDYDDLCADLKKREIILLAKIIKIVEHTDQKVEFIFDSSELEAAYELYREVKASQSIQHIPS